jgi:hypothetical protein
MTPLVESLLWAGGLLVMAVGAILLGRWMDRRDTRRERRWRECDLPRRRGDLPPPSRDAMRNGSERFPQDTADLNHRR